MRLIEHKKGYLYGAANREGESYTDWRAPYIDRSGLLMIYESNSRPGKFVFVFFTAPASGFAGHYLKTSPREPSEGDTGNRLSIGLMLNRCLRMATCFIYRQTECG